MNERRNDYTQLHESMASIRTTVDHIERELLGNGQPGAISKLTTAIENVRIEADGRMDSLEGRTSRLERWRSWVNGVSAAASAVFTAVGSAVLYYWEKRL